MRIHDSEWCWDKGELGAKCFHTHNDQTRTLAEQEWNDQRFGWVCTRGQTLGEWKANVLMLCNQTKSCTEAEMQVIRNLDVKLKFIQDQNEQLAPLK